MWAAPKACPACRKPSAQGSRFCEAHKGDPAASRHHGRVRDEIDRMYQRARWKKTRWLFLSNNPVCQRIHRAEQCQNPSTLVHHLLSPRNRPDLFTEPTNLCALCAHCHPDSEGTPEWVEGKDYVKTEFRIVPGYLGEDDV